MNSNMKKVGLGVLGMGVVLIGVCLNKKNKSVEDNIEVTVDLDEEIFTEMENNNGEIEEVQYNDEYFEHSLSEEASELKVYEYDDSRDNSEDDDEEYDDEEYETYETFLMRTGMEDTEQNYQKFMYGYF